MKKVILVIDEPECCGGCIAAHRNKKIGKEEYYWTCDIGYHTDKDYVRNIIDIYAETKPDWCPLKEIPEKYDMENVVCDRDYNGDYEYGYNACIDEILKDNKGWSEMIKASKL